LASLALAPALEARKLRIGIFADGPLQPRWAVEAFARLAASDFADVCLVETGSRAAEKPSAAWRLYGALDQRLFGSDPAERVALQSAEWGLRSGSGTDLDVAFALGEVDERALYARARYGVWRFQVDGLREVVDDEPLSGSRLVVRFASDRAPRLAYQSWSRTYPFSVARNRDPLLAKTAEFAWRALRELHRGGEAWLARCKELPQTPPHDDSLALKTPWGIAARLAGRGLDKALHLEQWSLAFRFGGEINADLQGFTRLVPPKDRDWADPFAIEKGGRYYVFFEELPYAERKAHISMIELAQDGTGAIRASPPQRVLECDYHLSYPFVFEHEGELYMLPESARNRSVELYRCVDFPLVWKLERALIDGLRLVDATLYQEKGGSRDRWWMFANSAAGESRMFDDELHLFHAESLHGEWRAHPRNPVKSDARCARPAGALFTRDGVLYRPAQVCVPRYGAGIAIQRVLKLTPTEYAERQLQRLLPGEASGLEGLHTMNRAGDLTVVDAFIRRKRI
jgi:hypothetical protein